MGYDLHITRRTDGSDNSCSAISLSEWQQAIGGDPDAEAFYWHAGEVSVKNPDPALIAKMFRLAESLGANVQGDDGEIYREDGSSFEPPSVLNVANRLSLLNCVVRLFRRHRLAPSPPFREGQRVKDILGGLGTVLSVDKKSRRGMGSVRVKMDDGRVHDRTCIASGFEIVGDESIGK